MNPGRRNVETKHTLWGFEIWFFDSFLARRRRKFRKKRRKIFGEGKYLFVEEGKNLKGK